MTAESENSLYEHPETESSLALARFGRFPGSLLLPRSTREKLKAAEGRAAASQHYSSTTASRHVLDLSLVTPFSQNGV